MIRPTQTTAGLVLGARPVGNVVSSIVPGTAKIMCVGDSWTDGQGFVGDGFSYRKGLIDRFTEIGVSVDFVGPFASPASGLPDNQHAGQGGTTLLAINGSIGAWLTTYTPDVVIILAGLNDARAGEVGATLNSRMATLLATMYATRPDMRVVPCFIPEGNLDATISGRIRAANALFPATFAGSSYGVAGRLRPADLRWCVPSSSPIDCVDAIPHPTAKSFTRIVDTLWPVTLNALGRNAEW